MRRAARLLAAVLLAAMALGLSACKEEEAVETVVAMVTDGGALLDGGYNQAVYEGVSAWCEEEGCAFRYYEPEDGSAAAIRDSMEQAYQEGAKVIVAAGSAFEQAVYEMQTVHSSLRFLLLDGQPHDVDYNYRTETNVHCVLFREEEGGFLAGYAAVMEGYRQLGFLGGVRLTGVLQYCYGFLRGADLAANDLGLEEGAVTFRYAYSDSFEKSSAVEQICAEWYAGGTELIFSACGSGWENVLDAAEAAGGGVVLSDFGCGERGETVFAVAEKGFAKAISLSLTALKRNGWQWKDGDAGQTATAGLAEGCVGLAGAEDGWPYGAFSYQAYSTLVQEIVDGYVSVPDEIGAFPSVSGLVSVVPPGE